MPSPVTEEELAGLRAGDEGLTSAVWRRYNPVVLRYLRARGCTDADDVAAQVWLEVARGLRRFDGDGAAFGRWLFTLAHRRMVDAGRRDRRRREDAVATPPEPRTTNGGVPEPDELERAIALVRRLPPGQADAVLLRVLGGYTPEEVGEVMGKSPGAVRVLTHRGLARLRELVDELDEAAARRSRPRRVTAPPSPALASTDG